MWAVGRAGRKPAIDGFVGGGCRKVSLVAGTVALQRYWISSDFVFALRARPVLRWLTVAPPRRQ